MVLRAETKKIDVVRDAYLNIMLFFWNHWGETETLEEKFKKHLVMYYETCKELEAHFEGDDFRSEEDRDAVEDDLEKLYYMIVDIDPASSTLHLINPVIEMIENDESELKCPR